MELNMKKIFIIAGAITLLSVLAKPGYSFFNITGGEHSMHLDARDAFNRPVECNYKFQTTSFFKAYSMLTPFGVSRWLHSPFASAEISQKKTFKIPFITVPFIYEERKILSCFSKKFVNRKSSYNINILFLILTLGIALKFNLPSKDEPRFRVPVLIE